MTIEQLVPLVLSCVVGLFVWLLRNTVEGYAQRISALETDVRAVRAEAAQDRLNAAQTYVPRDDMKRIDEKLDAIEAQLRTLGESIAALRGRPQSHGGR
jgi:hypothetical protein